MTIAIIIGICVVVAGLVLGIGFGTGVFRIERLENEYKQPSAPQSPGDTLPDFRRSSKEDTGSADVEAVDPGEIYDYFQEETDAEAEAPAKAAPVAGELTLVEYDKLCNLKTGRGYLIDCQQKLSTAREDGQIYAVAYLDFDRFRFINSLKGLSLGDYAISRLAQESQVLFPDGSKVTRISADHFVVFFPLTDESILADYAEQIRRVAERIRDDVGVKSGLRVSIGFATTQDAPRDTNIMTLIQMANVARHCMKSAKDQAFSVFNPSVTETLLYGEAAMDDYSDNQFEDTFNLYFQPLYDLAKGRAVGCESLARWTCEEESYKDVALTPDNGKLPTNSTKIIYQMCRWMGRWQKAGKELLMGCVALPITDLFKEDIDDYIAKCLSTFQVQEHSVVVAVDVSSIRVDWSVSSRQIKRLKDIGIRVAVYGIDRGYKSLDAIAGLPVDFVKLHASFAHHIDRDDDRREAARTIIAAAEDMNIQTIFEGVNTGHEMNTLKTLGANFIQGNFSGYPCQPEELVKALQESAENAKGYSNSTTILDDDSLAKGNFNLY